MPKLAAARLLPSKKTGQGAYGRDVRADDLYPTPPELVYPLPAIERLPENLWEPCAGMGDMVVPLIREGHVVYASDLVDYGRAPDGVRIKHKDFFSYTEAPLGITCIVTNPPFSEGARFVRHALTLVKKVCVLNRLGFLEGIRKSDVLDTKLARIWAFKERPPMMHRWSQGQYRLEKGVPVLDKQDGIWRQWIGKKAESAMPFAWFIFESDHDGEKDGINTRRVSWRSPPSKIEARK